MTEQIVEKRSADVDTIEPVVPEAPASKLEARPTRAEAIGQMWSHGRRLLQSSRCQEAEAVFASALRLHEEAIDPEIVGKGLYQMRHSALLKDKAFAMICGLRFGSGAEILRQYTANASSVHLNALGYARYQLKDYNGAGAAFSMALRADPSNKILWNNFAAAKLVAGDIGAADDAMYHALEPDQVTMDPWFQNLFLSNVNIIAQHAMGHRNVAPSIEMWYAPN